MKSAILSFVITLGMMMALRFSLNHRHAGAAAMHPHQDHNGAAGHTRAPSAQSAEAGSERSDPSVGESMPRRDSDPAVTAAIADLSAKVRGFASKRNTGGNIVPWWAALCELAELDPPLAIALLREAPDGFASAHALSGNTASIVAWWAAKDPDAALAWYWQDLDKGASPRSPDEIVETLASRDLRRAVGFLKQWAARKENTGGGQSITYDGLSAIEADAHRSVFRALAPHVRNAEDLELVFAGTRPDAGCAEPALAGYWQSLAETAGRTLKSAGAQAFFEKNPFPPDWPREYLHPAVRLLDTALRTDGDPKEWAEWIMTSVGPAAEPRTQAAVHLIKAWSVRDPEAAGNWLRTFAATDPAAAPLAMKTYAAAVLNEDPAAAMEWVSAIPQEDARRLAMIRIFPGWAGRDAAAARAWLENSNWPPEMKRLGKGALKAAEAGF